MRDAVVRRRSVRLAAVAAAGLLAGLLPGAEPASGGQAGRVSPTYDCRFPGGDREVPVGIQQSYPAVGVVGQLIRPGPLTLTVTLARAAAAGLFPAGTLAVGGTASLAVRVAQGASRADASWGGLAAPPTPLAGKGDLVLTLAGAVAPVTVTAGGAVTFAAGDLALDLTAVAAGVNPSPSPTRSPTAAPTAGAPSAAPSAAVPSAAVPSGAVPSGGAPSAATPVTPTSKGAAAAAPAALAVACALKAGTSAQLGSVAVPAQLPGPSAAPGSPSSSTSANPANPARPEKPSPAPSAGAVPGPGTIRVGPAVHSGLNDCPPAPIGALDPKRLPPLPPGATVIVPPSPPAPACGFAVGYANVAKLGQASVVNDPAENPAMVVLNMSRRFVLDFPAQYIEQDALGTLTLPVADTTFLTYGFIPTTAKMELKPVGLLTIVVTGSTVWQQPIEFTIAGYQTMRLFDVKVNGTPLDVGPNCHTASNVDLVLRGRQDDYLPGGGDGKPDYSIQGGGPLSQTDLTIPAFTGCGTHGEDLDPLFTAAVSGPGNSLNLIQAPLCTPDGTQDPANGCYPEIQIPELPHRR
ncbi:hypothetical protein GCM10009760_08070 [Kitasatospora kazusensis]|uniref:DUF6801 domain-containing protein n=1 Tax=Kitasatospora kazusensis TaxID=407974 RepID=A0ABP5KHY2_9ACTN